MARSARRRKASARGSGVLHKGAAALTEAISRNPTLVGGSTAFLVTLFYVSANALWYQPIPHSGAFFATRSIDNFPVAEPMEPETTINIVRPEAPRHEAPKGDPVVEQVQAILLRLGFYTGAADGLAGPATRDAVAAYQKKVGLPVTGVIDEALLTQLGTAPVPASVPTPAPRAETTSSIAAGESGNARIVKIQAGLKAFGNEDIQLDGVPGARTKAAIREFQAIFRLPVTGEADDAVYAKMREIGLTD